MILPSRILGSLASSTNHYPIVLLHGLFGFSDNLNSLASDLSADQPVILVDLVNHGHAAHRDDMSYPAMAQDVCDTLADMGVTQWIAAGHSMGGKVAMQIAAMAKQQTRALVVLDIAPVSYKPRHREIIEALKKVDATVISSRSQADELLREAIPEPLLRGFFLKNLVRNEQGIFSWRFGLSHIANAYVQIASAPELNGELMLPALFLRGGDSDYITTSHEPELFTCFPQATLVTIANAGHWLHMQKRSEVASRINAFVNELRSAD